MKSNSYSSNYYQNNGQSGDRLALGMYFRILRFFLPKFNSKVLEYGAGNGFLSRRIASKYQSEAVEISKFAIKNIKMNSPLTKIVEEKNLKSNYYDAVVSLHTLEHLEFPHKTIRSLHSSLKKNGIILVVMPDLNSWGHKLKKEKWFGFRDKTHISLLTADNWIKIFTDTGFEITKTGSDWLWDPPYLPVIPNIIQKIVFYPGCLLMVVLGRIIFPKGMGEDIVLVARKN